MTPPEHALIVGDVPETPPTCPVDPFQALDDLMVVLEALCPRWPARPPSTDITDMRM